MLKGENKKTVLFVVPDGTGIRNYLFSDIIPKLHKAGKNIYIYHSLDDKALDEVRKIHKIKFESKNISHYRETIKQKFLREVIAFSRLKYNANLVNNDTILTNWNRNRKGTKKYFYKLVEGIGNYYSKKYSRILWLEEKYQKSLLISINKEIKFLKDLTVESLFCTHQRAINAIPIIKAANVLKIKTIGAIYSWDNIPKGRLSVRTQKYLVWSNYMKNELLQFYPEINLESIVITGTPQFEFYNDESIFLNREIFFKNQNLDLNKITICFSGDDELTSPYDPNYLEDLADEILKNNKENDVQIIFRRSPVDLSGRYDKVINKYKAFIVPIRPLWSNNREHWSTLFPSFNDVKLLANICKHSDLVINLGSTMAHDFAIFNKPAAYLNYNSVIDKRWSVETIYKFQHFRSMPNQNQLYWINSKEEILKIINLAINHKKSLGKEWLRVINCDNKNSSLNIVNQILN
ncbi:hypothetical protein [Polaribacter sp. KT 15]|uniref:hypothetical protein n=1 Tax=Polaribacter sp. KT 15 TaxID=1896175 RepID=UPI0009098FB5|nr:hypothetical protein [Polaribacter sp. KT 15]SHN09659.1 hypothetical protein SAMN05720268_2881 [Polaribacter sp. KT 15]